MSDIINLWLDDEYGLRQRGGDPSTIVDVGANIGLFSLWARYFYPEANITAIEPNPRVYHECCKNLANSNVKVLNVGISQREGRAMMDDTGNSRNASTVPMSDGDIHLMPLSSILEELGGSIDLLKMDCEGFEWDIFSDSKAFEGIGEIRMEYHLGSSHTIESLKCITHDLGYRMTHCNPNQGFGIAWFEKR